MNRLELIAPCHFGLESVLKREIDDLGYDISHVEDGRVTFIGDGEAVCRANICLRTAERILLKVGQFHAETFEELFQGTKAIPWEEYIPKEGKFWVAKAASVKSRLFSTSDIQSVMKKAMVTRMEQHYRIRRFTETGESYPVRVFVHKDEVTVAIDTTGVSLHKRGYRPPGRQGAYIGDAGCGAYYADAVEKRPHPRRSVLRKRNDTDRGGYDRRQYRAGSQPPFPGGGLEAHDRSPFVV